MSDRAREVKTLGVTEPLTFEQWLRGHRGINAVRNSPNDWVELGQDYAEYRLKWGAAPSLDTAQFCFECITQDKCASGEICYGMHAGFPKFAGGRADSPSTFTSQRTAMIPPAIQTLRLADAARIGEIRARVEKVLAQLPLTEEPAGSGEFDCPMCDGDGSINTKYVKTFDTTKASGIQVYGIGEALTDLEAFIKQVYSDIPYLLAEVERLRHNLCNLLAIIHRDGGHKTGELGLEESVNLAHKVWAELITKADETERLRGERDQLKAEGADQRTVRAGGGPAAPDDAA